MGAGKTTLAREVASRLGAHRGRRGPADRRAGAGARSETSSRSAASSSSAWSRRRSSATRSRRRRRPSIALGGGAVKTASVRKALADRALTVLVEIDVDTAWERVRGSDRPLAQDETEFRRLYDEREPLYREVADAVAGDADGVILAAAGVHHELGALERLGELVPGTGPVALVTDSTVMGIHGAAAQNALGDRLSSTHELPRGEAAKQLHVVERLWSELRLDRGGHRGGARRRLARPTPPGLAAATLPARRAVGGGADDARRPGRCRDRRQDRDRHPAGQEPRRRVPLAGPRRDRRGAARDAAGARTAPGRGRADQDASCSPAARSTCARPRRTRPPSACATRTTAGRGDGSTSATRSRTRSRRRPTSTCRTARRSRSACWPRCGCAAAIPRRSSSALDPQPVAVDRDRAWQALLRDKKRSGDVDQPRPARRRRAVRRCPIAGRGPGRPGYADFLMQVLVLNGVNLTCSGAATGRSTAA